MPYKSTGAIIVGTLLLLLGMTGCGGEAVYRVKGKITFDGKPLQGGGAISFIPLGKQRMAGGEIAEDGSFTLTSINAGDGAMPGDFRVAIVQVTEKEPEMVPDGQKVKKTTNSVVPLNERIPLIYADQLKTPLTAKVEATNGQEINFDIKRK